MGKGFLTLKTARLFGDGIRVTVKDIYGKVLHEAQTDPQGMTRPLAVAAPDAALTLRQDHTEPCFTMVDVDVRGDAAYTPVVIRNVPVFDGVTSVLPASLTQQGEFSYIEKSLPPVFGLQFPHEQQGDSFYFHYIPETVVVHLGRPAAEAPNITLPFADYIKTAASCELYPTWPEAALEANIYCIIIIALHRLHTAWYRQREYAFDITGSVSFDPLFIPERPVFDNIGRIVDRLLRRFAAHGGHAYKRFTPYCNGATTACPGLSQWGAVEMALHRARAADILRYYFEETPASKEASEGGRRRAFVRRASVVYRALLALRHPL